MSEKPEKNVLDISDEKKYFNNKNIYWGNIWVPALQMTYWVSNPQT